VLGRLAPGATSGSAQGELNAIKRRVESGYPDYKRTWGVGVQPLQQLLGQESKPVLLLLFGAVALVLLIACANVANLLLARAGARHREIALRGALGATGRRIARQLITESLLLAFVGGALGVGLAVAGVDVLGTLSARLLPATMEPHIDLRVLAFALLVSGGTGLLFGLFPAWRVRRLDLNAAMKQGSSGTTDGGRTRSQSTLVIVEGALTAVLLVASGTLLRALVASVTADPGIRSDHVLMFDLTMPYGGRYGGPEQRMTFLDQALEAIRAVPGVASAATVDDLPFGDNGQGYTYSLEEKLDTRQDRAARIKYVSSDYFATLGATLVRGRPITAEDNRADAPRVLVVNERLVRDSFGDDNPLGRHLYMNEQRWEIVGVVADMRIDVLHTPPLPMYFAPHWRFPWGSAFLVRTHGDPAAVTAAVAAAVHQLDPNLPLANVGTLDAAMADALGPQKVVLNLVGGFAATALLLAAIGLYGVMSYAVVCRRRELSIRAALGALRLDIVRLVIGQGTRMITAGLGVGLLVAFVVAQILAGRTNAVNGSDPLIFVGAAGILVVVSLLACWLPARRAARANPIEALRND
jgi:predicted permease